MPSAILHVYGSLNDFLPVTARHQAISYFFKEPPAVKHAIESTGIPHAEVKFILINKTPCSFQYLLCDNDTVEIYPAETDLFPEAWSVMPQPAVPERFVADVHLRKLAKGLRLIGFDTLYENNYSDHFIVSLSNEERRIILTRDRNLLKIKMVEYGYWIRSQDPFEQVTEVIRRYRLGENLHFFKRCVECNGNIEQVPKAAVYDRLEPKTKLYYQDFYQCTRCQRIYWKGSHYQRLEDYIEKMKRACGIP